MAMTPGTTAAMCPVISIQSRRVPRRLRSRIAPGRQPSSTHSCDRSPGRRERRPPVGEPASSAARHFRQDPDRLFRLPPRQFEELIAELLQGFGFAVELTQATRDGGRDIIAVAHNPARLKYLIECKRYAKTRRVGIAPVQRLHGVARAEGATKGILVTTAKGFTKPAQAFLDKERWLLEGHGFDGLVKWLDEYDKFQMIRMVVPEARF